MENPNYYAIIPANVRYDNELKANEKLLYGEITALAQASGKCFASNDYFAGLYSTSKETVSRWISNLKKCGYIDVIIIYKNDGKTIDKRIITLLTKKSIPSCEKNQYPIDENIKDNNTSINNTSIKEKINKKDFDLAEIENELSEKFASDYVEMKYSLDVENFNNWIEHRKDLNKKLTATSAKLQVKLLCKYPKDIQAEIINTSIQNGYQGLFEPKGQKQFNQPTNKRENFNNLVNEVFADLEEQRETVFDVEIVE